MNRIKSIFIVFFLCTSCIINAGEVLKRAGNSDVQLFNDGWRFHRYGLLADGTRLEEPVDICKEAWDDSDWRGVAIPHDFGIEGPFRMDLAGNTGRLPFQGIGWYRKTFKLDKRDRDQQVYIDFDGVMANGKVWLNGHYVGTWPYGYNSFRLDLTPYMNWDGNNILAVRTDTEKWDSRWYSGAGIYRNVWLVKTGKAHVKHWGTFITTDRFEGDSVRLNLKVELENRAKEHARVTVETDIFELDVKDRIGRKIAELEEHDFLLDASSAKELVYTHTLTHYKKWDIDSPNRYVARFKVMMDGRKTDCYYTPFGIRQISFSREGFLLNGRKVNIKGVCLHHDLGSLGSAFNKSALERQLLIMQEVGCNSIRTSHNPPAPELLELADKKGILIIDEAFDAWAKGKREWDYNKLYQEWHAKDLQAMVLRDKNHPSVIIWSIGNEVMEQKNVEMTRHLVEIVKEMDTTRPVTNGYNDPNGGRSSGACVALDIMGVNYFFSQQAKWDADPRYKDKPTIGTETSSCVSSRGVYFFDGVKRQDFQITSYDYDAPGWGCSPDIQFATNARFPHLLGEYVWTGFDYLGEPTPFNSDKTNLLNFRTDPAKQKELEQQLAELKKKQAPSRSSYFGMVDLAGFPKDRYYLYQSHWRPELPIAHILPHWNWADRIGKVVPVHIYTSGTEAELFVNGKSYGRRVKKEGKDFRLIWDHVIYEPGTIKVIAYKDNKFWAENEIKTAGRASRISVTSDRMNIANDGYEYAFITLKMVDKEGNFMPISQNLLSIRITGCGELVATDNGDPTSFTPFQSSERTAFNGMALAIVRAKRGSKGKIKIQVVGEGLEPTSLILRAVQK